MTGNKRGFSVVEIIVVVAIVAIVSVAAVPVAEIAYIRTQEELLRNNLETIRQAIDNWKQDCRIAISRQVSPADLMKVHESQFYPPSLMALVNPNASYDIVIDDIEFLFYPRKYLQNIPADPFVRSVTWKIHYASGSNTEIFDGEDPVIPAQHRGIFDISPVADVNLRRGFTTAVNGTQYANW